MNKAPFETADDLAEAQLSLSAQLQRKLEKLILNGELKPGEKLNELDLSKRFGTSRGPLREAMQNLCARGLAEAVRNRGVFVRTISPEEAFELYDVRAALFGLAGYLLTDRINDTILENLHVYLDRMETLAKKRSVPEYYRANLEFHDYLVRSAGNKALLIEYHSFVNRLHLCRMRVLVSEGGLSVSNREHAEMVDAAASGDNQRAQQTFFRHVERAKMRFRATLDREEMTQDVTAAPVQKG
ncbi:FCD domain-containing protein [Thetidibacter halocola]|uniref:FCD domain-containing protein n=1 Tax=Thetidibacter halocola TaxID=2827239 RepID=A0A8J7WG13_9RHOB|nr:FCD domain-containing protein [Thetidibacter halocola]MBS0125016.1 FCD domain-containing protein [Thetidibacter halocola]